MHRDDLDPRPADSSAESALENQWLVQRRRKLYMVLTIWYVPVHTRQQSKHGGIVLTRGPRDTSMSIMLGRPGVTNWRQARPSPPVDTVMPKDRSRTPVVPRDEYREPPTPLSVGLWLLQLNGPLCDIQDLEQDGPYPKDFSKVDKVHQRIMDLNERKPAMFRVENPDTQWDGFPETSWLSFIRAYFGTLHEFSLIGLHRPYIFHRRKSRDEALKASINLLEMSRLMFEGLPPDHWRK